MRRAMIETVAILVVTLGTTGGMAVAGGSPPAPPAPKTAPDADPAARAEIQRLRAAVDYDSMSDLVGRGADRPTLLALLSAARGNAFDVQRTALLLVERIVVQGALQSRADLELISSSVDEIAGATSARLEDERLHVLAERVRWRLAVGRIESPSERAEYLRPFLEGEGRDAVWQAYEAIWYLAELGPHGRAVLIGLKDASRKRSISPTLLQRVDSGLARLDIEDDLRVAGPGRDPVVRLLRGLETAASNPSLSGYELCAWIVIRLTQLDATTPHDLKAIRENERLGPRAGAIAGRGRVPWGLP